MGTNYYLLTDTDPCPHCGRSGEKLHIGKSSAGWVFSLHIYPGKGIKELVDWLPLFWGGLIVDEYGGCVSVVGMLDIILNRSGGLTPPSDDFLADNSACRYANRLARPLRDPVGEGSYSLCDYEFS